MDLGNTIKSIRKSKGMSQADLANECGLSKNGLWNYENNNRTPSIATLIDIANALDVPFRDLLDNVDDISIHCSTKEDQEKINNANEGNQEILDIIYNSKDINELFSLLIEKSFLSQDFTKNNIDIISDHLENPKETDYYTENFKEFVNGLSKIYKTYLDIFLTFKSSEEGE